MSLESESAAGTRAKETLDALSETFEALEREYFEAWKQCPQRDTEGRERLYMACQIVLKVREHLRSVSDTGKLARKQIDDIKKAGNRKVLGVI